MHRIKELREKAGWTQSELASRLGREQQAVSKYERFSVDLDTDMIRRLCEIFGCTADYLLCMSDQRTAAISEDDAAILAAYHALSPELLGIVDHILLPYLEKKTSSASQDAQGGD